MPFIGMGTVFLQKYFSKNIFEKCFSKSFFRSTVFEKFQNMSTLTNFRLGRSFLQNRLKRVSPKFHADWSYPRDVNDLSKFSNFFVNVQIEWAKCTKCEN